MDARRSTTIDVLDHLLHLVWQVCAVVGLFAVAGLVGGVRDWDGLAVPVTLGLVFGVLTSPAVVRRVRPGLRRRFPWAFDGDAVRARGE